MSMKDFYAEQIDLLKFKRELVQEGFISWISRRSIAEIRTGLDKYQKVVNDFNSLTEYYEKCIRYENDKQLKNNAEKTEDKGDKK